MDLIRAIPTQQLHSRGARINQRASTLPLNEMLILNHHNFQKQGHVCNILNILVYCDMLLRTDKLVENRDDGVCAPLCCSNC